jgi:hypothetical protein
MSWPVILSGVVCVAMLALGFNSLLPLGSGLETVCVLNRRRLRYGLFQPCGWPIAEPSKRRLKRASRRWRCLFALHRLLQLLILEESKWQIRTLLHQIKSLCQPIS